MRIIYAKCEAMANLLEIAKDTMGILEQGYYINSRNKRQEVSPWLQAAVANTTLYTPAALDKLLASFKPDARFTTAFEVTNETTLDAARRLGNEAEVAALNFASAKNPGGGFLRGASAQEESIARASGLYSCLLQAEEYYRYHRTLGTCLYSDHMIYSPAVPVFKYDDGRLMDEVLPLTVVTSAAVNAGVVAQQEKNNIAQIEPVMRLRVNKLLALLATKRQHTLILGAWGCGVFQNDPRMIAGLFHEALLGKFENCFQRVVFAVKTNNENMIAPFRELFLPS